MRLVTSMPIRFFLLLLISVLFVFGCSSSSDSSSAGSQSPADVTAINGDGVTSNESTNGVVNEMEATNTGDTTSSPIDEVTDAVDGSTTGLSESEQASTTRVNFNITVPVYVSNALQVRLVWGDVDTTAVWNSDELWTATVDFPVNTTNQLVVTFSDGNGATTLGSVERSFTTGANQSESLQIAADEFDTDRWDSDGDGISNFVEKIEGTDPLFDEIGQLELRDSYLQSGLLAVDAWKYESIITTLPFSEHSENLNPSIFDEEEGRFTWGLSETLTIDIDASGMGSVYEYFEEGDPSNLTVITDSANRRKSDSSIIWTGSTEGSGFSGDFRSYQQYSIETKLIGESARTQIAESNYENWGYSDSRITTVSYTLTGSPIENSSTCEPVYGSYTIETNFKLNNGNTDSRATVTKDLGDAVWLVKIVTSDGESIEEYRASSLGVEYYCDFRGIN